MTSNSFLARGEADVRPRGAAAACLSAPLPSPSLVTPRGRRRRPGFGRRSRAGPARRRGQYIDLAEGQGHGRPGAVPMPQLPEGSPFQDFFDDFFKNRQGEQGDGGSQKVQSLGSGFVVDAEQASSSPTTT